MGLSKLAAKCQACPYVNTCNHKRMEAIGYLQLPEPIVEVQVDLSAPTVEDMMKHTSVQILLSALESRDFGSVLSNLS